MLAALLALRGVRGPRRRSLLALLALGAIGYAGQSTLFYLSLQRGTAATSILLFYAYPALVCAIGWLALREGRPVGAHRRRARAVGRRAARSSPRAAGRSRSTRSPSCSRSARRSCSRSTCIAGQRLAAGVDAMVKAAGVAAGAAVASLGPGRAHRTGSSRPAGAGCCSSPTALFTAAAFTLMFAALARLGARHTSIVMTLEAVFAVGLAALLLGEPLGLWQALGGAAVLARDARRRVRRRGRNASAVSGRACRSSGARARSRPRGR